MKEPMDCEVLVFGNDHRSGLRGTRADRIVRRFGKTAVGYVFSSVAKRLNSVCESRRELSVDEEAQSCAPQHRMVVLLGRKLQHRRDIVGFQIGIVRQNFFARGTSGEQVENVLDADTKPTNTRTTAADIRVDGNAVNRGLSSLYRG